MKKDLEVLAGEEIMALDSEVEKEEGLAAEPIV